MKKLLILMMTVLMLTGLLAGCSGGNSASDKEYVQKKGTLVVGMTDFAPMDYKEDGSDEWIGFDADMARAFAKELGVEVEFTVLSNWDQKATELSTKSVDVVWNGMTLTDEVKSLMGTSKPYCKNAQVVVLKKDIADQYTTADSIKTLTFAVENGSAGAEALDALDVKYTAVGDQGRALLEVASGSVQACVIDLLMAGAMIGEGTDYAALTTAVELTTEDYGVGFRKDSDLVDTFNTFWKKAYDDGTVMATAEKYGIAKNVIAQ